MVVLFFNLYEELLLHGVNIPVKAAQIVLCEVFCCVYISSVHFIFYNLSMEVVSCVTLSLCTTAKVEIQQVFQLHFYIMSVCVLIIFVMSVSSNVQLYKTKVKKSSLSVVSGKADFQK